MKSLFFDFDGTIADSAQGIIESIHYMIDAMHLPHLPEATYRNFIGPSLTTSMNRYYPSLTAAEVTKTIHYYQEHYQAQGIFELTLYPGITQALAALQQAGYQLNIATAKPEPMVQRITAHFDLTPYFAGVYGATLDERIRSSKTAVLAYALEEAKADPKQSLMIGDRETDMIGGLNNHVQTLGVTYGFGDAHELAEAHAAALVGTPGELPAAIGRLLSVE